MRVNVELLWYNPSEMEYQIGDRETYKKVISNVHHPHNFIILEKFVNLSEHLKNKLKTRIKIFNSYRRTSHLKLA